MSPRATRRQLLVRGAAAAALLPAAGALAVPGSALASEGSDRAIPVPDRLARLVQIELLLLFCYEHVLSGDVLTPRARRTLSPFVAHERAHIAALERQLHARGGTVPPGPADIHAANRDLAHRKIGGRLGQLKGDPDAVRLLLTLEQTTIGAYFVALRTLPDPSLIELACQIMANEAQHDAMLGLLLPKATLASAVPYGLVQGLQ